MLYENKIDEMDFTLHTIIRAINEWQYIYQREDTGDLNIQKKLQRGYNNISSWVDCNQDIFYRDKHLLPRHYFNLPENRANTRTNAYKFRSQYMRAKYKMNLHNHKSRSIITGGLGEMIDIFTDRNTTISIVSTWLLSIAEYLQDNPGYDDKQRQLEIKKVKRGLNRSA